MYALITKAFASSFLLGFHTHIPRTDSNSATLGHEELLARCYKNYICSEIFQYATLIYFLTKITTPYICICSSYDILILLVGLYFTQFFF
jgi:hypothetical protein